VIGGQDGGRREGGKCAERKKSVKITVKDVVQNPGHIQVDEVSMADWPASGESTYNEWWVARRGVKRRKGVVKKAQEFRGSTVYLHRQSAEK